MQRKAALCLLSFLVGLSVAAVGCAGEEPPAAGHELASQGAAVVNSTSKVTLCTLPRFTKQTTVRLCGYATSGTDGSAIASVWFTVDGGAPLAVVPGSGGFVDTSTSLSEGTHRLRLSARSAAGNVTFEEQLVTVDLAPPVLKVLSPTRTDVMTSTVVNVMSSVSDVAPVRVQTQWVRSSTVDSGVGTVTHTVDLINRGYNTLLVRATDAVGNTSEARVTVYFCPSSDAACASSAHWVPVIVDTFQSTSTVPASGGVTFRVAASDPQSSPLAFSWTANIGTLGVPAVGATTSEVVWTPPACVPAGTTPSITATVTNALGASVSASFSLAADAACPPLSVCGDGVTTGAEACDDGNTTSEVSCPYGQASCSRCNATCTAVLNLTGAFCGDGVKNGGEVCDDGNAVTETACPSGQATCTRCNATCTAVLNLTVASCGVGSHCASGVCTSGMCAPVCGAGAFCPTANTTLCGTQNYTAVYIPAGVTVKCASGCTTPVVLNVSGNVTIAGTLALNGGDGFLGAYTRLLPNEANGGSGGTGTCGGGRGGNGGHSPNSAGGRGGGTGGGGNGVSKFQDSVNINGGNGSGAGHATPGIIGYSGGAFSGTSNPPGGTYGSPQLTQLLGGSGGGGGSGGLGNNSDGYGGDGGGGGGGALKIVAAGYIAIAPTGTVQANGGVGAVRTPGVGGDGGAGSGGAVWLAAPAVVNRGSVKAVGGVSSSPANGGAGGTGRIRVDTSGAATPAGSFEPAIGFTGAYP